MLDGGSEGGSTLPRVAVVGGGVSGLSVVWYLLSSGVRDVVLFERKTRLGGKAFTLEEDGYIVEAGPNGFLDNKPFAMDLCKSIGLGESLYPSSDSARKRFLLINNSLVEIPISPVSFFKSPLVSWKAKFRLFLEPFVPKTSAEDETVFDFVKRRLGCEFASLLVDSMVAGVFAGNSRRLSMKAAFPVLWDLEQKYGGLIKGMFSLMRERKSKGGPAGPGGKLWSLEKGVGQLINALYRKIKDAVDIRISQRVIHIRKEKVWEVYTDKGVESFNAVVLSLPAYEAAYLLGEYPRLRGLLSRIDYAPITVVALGFDKKDIDHSLDGFGFLVPASEGKQILGCLWDSSIFPNRAPKGKVLLRAMLAGDRQPEVFEYPDDLSVKTVLDVLDGIMGIRSFPNKVWVFRHSKGIPQYRLGHVELVNAIETEGKSLGGLFFCSNAYRGVGLNDCVGSAARVSREVVHYLEGEWSP